MDNRKFDTFKERFGYEVENLRRMRRIKQKDLAKMLNITQSSLSNLERGKNDITLETFCKLAEIFGSIIVFNAVLAYFNTDINEKFKKEWPKAAYELFIAWTKYLKDKGESVVFKRHYENDKFRVD